MRLLYLLLLSPGMLFAQFAQGWTQISGTTISSAVAPTGYLGSVCPSPSTSLCPAGSPIPFSDPIRINALILAWNGAVWDSLHKQMILPAGGGHDDGFDNSAFGVKTSGSVSRLVGPSTNIVGGIFPDVDANPDGTPVSRHTYDGIAEMGYRSGYFVIAEGSTYPNGQNPGGLWLLDTNQSPAAWTSLSKTGTPPGIATDTPYSSLVWDSVANRLLLLYNGALYAVTVNVSTATATFTRLSSGSMNGYQPTCEIDPVMRTPIGTASAGRWMVCIGDGYSDTPPGTFYIQATDISGNDPTYTPLTWTSNANGTCDGLHNLSGSQGGPGFSYDDALGMIVGYPNAGGNTVYAYSTVTQQCTAIAFPGGPAAQQNLDGNYHGTFGRFRYVREGNYFATVLSAVGNAYVLNLDSPIPGLGSSTSTCIDADGDGYGTGSGCLGPDANDQDATIHTAAQAIGKYGSIDATFQLRNYHPTRYWTVDPASGNDGTGASCTPANLGTGGGSDCKPYQHWSALSGSVAAGDAVVFRAGTYSYPVTIVQGTSSASVYYLTYPGESATFAAYPNYWTVIDKAYWVIDGLRFDGQGDSTSGTGCIVGGTGDLQSGSTQHDFIVRNVECKNWLNGPYMFNGLQNGLIESSSFHDMTGSHGIYLGSRAMVSNNITIRRNLLYRNSRCGVQFNGRVSDLHIEQNYAYQNGIVDGGDDICLENGVHDSFIRGNVSLGSAFGITMNTYDGSEFGGVGSSSNCGAAQNQNCTCGASPNLFAICAFSEFNNLFSNNTAVNTGQDVNGADISGNPLYQIGRQPTDCTTATCLATSFPNNTWQNMVILSKGLASFAPPWTFTGGTTAPESGPTNTLNQVVYFQTAGTAEVVGYGLQVGCCGYQSYSCAAAVSGGHIGSATNCTKSDPKFTALGAYNNIAGYNLRLQPSSPALTGAIIPGSLPMDILGAPIVSGSLGAYEGTVVAIPSITFGGRVVIHP